MIRILFALENLSIEAFKEQYTHGSILFGLMGLIAQLL